METIPSPASKSRREGHDEVTEFGAMIADRLTATACRIRRTWRLPCLTWVVLAGLTGCGTKEVWIPEVTEAAFPTKGKVLLPGGSPLKSGRVELIPVREPGRIAIGEIAPDGTFALKTREPGDGAVPGEYKVRIMIPEKAEFRKLARYRDEDGSLLKVTIKAEPNQLDPFLLK
jgi:hypothetical protein